MQNQQTNFNLVQSSQQIKCPAHQYNTITLLNTTLNALHGERLLCNDCDPLRKQLIFFQKAQDILMQWYDKEVTQVTSLEKTLDFQQFLKETQSQATEIHSKLLGSVMKKLKERLDKCFEKINQKSGRIQKFKKGFLELEKIMEQYLDKAKAQSELEPILRQLISDDPLTPEIVHKIGNLISLNLSNGVPSEKFQNRKIHEQSLQKIKEMQEKVLKLLSGSNKAIYKEHKPYKSQQIKYLPIIQKEQIKLAKKIKSLKCEQHDLPIEIINITPGKQIKTRGQCTKCDVNQFQFPQKVEELLFNWYQQEQNQINRYLDLLDKQQFIEKIMGQLEQAEFSFKQLVSRNIELANQQYYKIQSEIQTWFDDLFQLCSENFKIYHEKELVKLKNKFFVTNFIARFNKPGEQISLEFMSDIAIFLSHNYLQDQGYVYRQFVKINQEIVDNMKQSMNQFQIQNQFIVNFILTNQFRRINTLNSVQWNSPAILSEDMSLITQISQSELLLQDSVNQQVIAKFPIHNIRLDTVQISPNKQYIAFGITQDNKICSYQLLQKKFPILSGHIKPVIQLKFTQNSQFLFSSSLDTTIIQWNISSDGSLVRTFNFDNFIFSFALSSTLLAVVGDSVCLNLWKIDSPIHPSQFKIDPFCCYAIEFSKTKNFIATGGSELIIKLWDIKSVEQGTINLIKQFKGHQNFTNNKRINQIQFSQDEKYLFSSSNSDNNLIIWDLNLEKILQVIPMELYKYPNIYFLSQDMARMIISDGHKNIQVYQKQKFSYF